MSMSTRGPIKKPKKPVFGPPDGKRARQMLLGMALGWHVAEQSITKAYFILKTRLEAQLLFMLMAPFLAVPAFIIAIPVASMAITGMAVAGVSSNLAMFTSIQTMTERQQFEKSKFRRSTSDLSTLKDSSPKAPLMVRRRRLDATGPSKRLTRSRTFTFGTRT